MQGAALLAQQSQRRATPLIVDQLIELYGTEEHDGHAAVTLHLKKYCFRSTERDLGRRPVSRLADKFGWHVGPKKEHISVYFT